MSTAHRLTEFERDTEMILTQVAKELEGCRQAIGLLARGTDNNAQRLERLEQALKLAAEASTSPSETPENGE